MVVTTPALHPAKIHQAGPVEVMRLRHGAIRYEQRCLRCDRLLRSAREPAAAGGWYWWRIGQRVGEHTDPDLGLPFYPADGVRLAGESACSSGVDVCVTVERIA